jgi:hypothetical protein
MSLSNRNFITGSVQILNSQLGGLFGDTYFILFISGLLILIFYPLIKRNSNARLVILSTLILSLSLIFFLKYVPVAEQYPQDRIYFAISDVFLYTFLLICIILSLKIKLPILPDDNNQLTIFKDNYIKILIPLILIAKYYFIFGSAVVEGAMNITCGCFLYLQNLNPYMNGVYSTKYGPVLFFTQIPFVPAAFITQHLLYGDALIPYPKVSEWKLCEGLVHTSGVFYDLIGMVIFGRIAQKHKWPAMLLWCIHPFNSFILAVGAPGYYQMILILIAFKMRTRAAISGIMLGLAGLCKVYPIFIAPLWAGIYKKTNRKIFCITVLIVFGIGLYSWMKQVHIYLPSQDPAIIHYLVNEGGYRFSGIYFWANVFSSPLTVNLFRIIASFSITLITFYFIYFKNISHKFVRSAILISCAVSIFTPQLHPDYMTHIVMLLLAGVLFSSKEDA